MPSDIIYETIAGYNLTDDPSLAHDMFGLSEKVVQIQEELYPDVLKGKQKTINRLIKLCSQYPHIPHFKNYLQMAYAASGNDRKVREMTRWIVDEHPDYLFGKITLADQYIKEGMLEKIPEILGHDLELRSLYPHRKIFHFAEMLTYTHTAIIYFLACDKPKKAKERMEIMDQIDPNDEKTILARSSLMAYNIGTMRKRFEEDEKIRRRVISRSYDKSVQNENPPVFTHPEIEKLYSSGVDIEHQVLRDVLALPRETLVPDLEKVLRDSINRFEYFRDKYEDAGWVDEEKSFSIHALILLGELNSGSSLPVVLHLLRQGEELLDFWYGYYLERAVIHAIFRIGKDELEVLTSFLREPDNYMNARLSVSKTIKLIGIQYPELRSEVISIYKDLFLFVLDNLKDDRVIDTELISFWIWDCMDLKAKELVGLIEELYRNKLVFDTICGTLDEVVRGINTGTMSTMLALQENIFEFYKTLNPENPEKEVQRSKDQNDFYESMFDKRVMNDLISQGKYPLDEIPDDDYFAPDNDRRLDLPGKDANIKVGRNDPCPCGSGKKFKKCCME